MDEIRKALQNARQARAEHLMKGFGAQQMEDDIEKARNVGEMHPNGKWAWTEYKPGKFDWRTAKKGASGGGSATPPKSKGVTKGKAKKGSPGKFTQSELKERADEWIKKVSSKFEELTEDGFIASHVTKVYHAGGGSTPKKTFNRYVILDDGKVVRAERSESLGELRKKVADKAGEAKKEALKYVGKHDIIKDGEKAFIEVEYDELFEMFSYSGKTESGLSLSGSDVSVERLEELLSQKPAKTKAPKVETSKPATKYYTEVDEEFVDEDTGDVIKMKRQGITAEGRKALEGVLEGVKSKHIDAIQAQINVTNELYSKWSNLEGELADLKIAVDEMGGDRLKTEVDMEEEYGKTLFELHDKISNEYGDRFNEIDDEMQELLDEIKNIEPLVEEAHEKLNEAQRVQSDMIHKMKDEQKEAVKAFEKKHGYKK